MGEFLTPDFRAPFDLDVYRRLIPPNAQVRGHFLNDALEEIRGAGKEPTGLKSSYLGFKLYPITEYVETLAQASSAVYPRLPLREGLRQLGRSVYPRFAQTRVGQSIFMFAGNRFEDIARVAEKAYGVSVNLGSCRSEVRPGHVVVQFRDLWLFLDTLQVGIWEGALLSSGVHGQVKLDLKSPCDADLEIRWR